MKAIIDKKFPSFYFTKINAHLIQSNCFLFQKFVKIFFWISLRRYQREKRRMGGGEVVIDNFDGDIKLKLDLSRTMGKALYWTGFHEFREFIFLHRLLRSDMIMIDAGSNQGEYTLFAAKRLKQGRVLAFEPHPQMLNVLRENISLNQFKNIEIFEVGLSDQEGVLNLFEIDDAHEGLATLYPGDRKTKNSWVVKLKSLDDLAGSIFLSKLDLLKIDIEGGELKALQGARGIILKFKPLVLIEMNQITFQAGGYHVEDVNKFFLELNFRPFQIDKRGALVPCEKLPSFGNLVYQETST